MLEEKQKRPYVKDYVERFFKQPFRNATIEEQKNGIDFVGINESKITVEQKLRREDERRYMKADILVEIISDDQKWSDGWIVYSQALYLVYLFEPVTNLQGHIILMQDLKKLWKENTDKENWEKKYAENVGYTTINEVMPLSFIPKSLFVYSDIVDLQQTLTMFFR